MYRILSRRRCSESGQGFMEYALVVVLVALISILILSMLGPSISNLYCEMVTTLGGTCNIGDEGDGGDDAHDLVVIIRADYNSDKQELHIDATSNGDYYPDVTLTASPGGVMEQRAHHYHLIFTLTGCPCAVTVTSSAGGSATVIVEP
jgi:pilus assembly protein Flp/PilA